MDEIKKIEVQGQQYGIADLLMRSVMGGKAQVVEWSGTHNMNDYKDAGTYRIKGERTGSPMDDNLPIMNSGASNTIEGILYVLDSSLTGGTGETTDCTVTQFLMLSNRAGGQEGDMYMRSGYGATKDNLTWKPWEKYQTNMEVGCVSEGYLLNPTNPTQVLQHGIGMRCFLDNGIYSGVYVGPKTMIGTTPDVNVMDIKDLTAIETFVMIVINNYVAYGATKHVTQIKFGVTNGGVFSMEKRVANSFNVNGIGNTYGDFSQWVPIGGGNGEWDEITYKIVHPTISYAGISLGAGSSLGNATQVGAVTKIGDFTNISDHIDIMKDETGFLLDHKMGTSAVEGDTVKLPYGLNAQNVTWNHESNANTFTTQGYYLITGERTAHQDNDNLPLSDDTLGSGHTLRMVLTVLDSSITRTEGEQMNDDCCITQILQCSNRTGGDGNVYVRTASGFTKNSLEWEPWGKLQTNVEVGQVTSLDPFIDNGMYSGVYTDGSTFAETFVLVTINNYAAAGAFGASRSISQFKYSLNVDGTVTMKYRVRSDSDGNWRDWSDIGGSIGEWSEWGKDFIIKNPFLYDIRIGSGAIFNATLEECKENNGQVRIGNNTKIYPNTRIQTTDNGTMKVSCSGINDVDFKGWSTIGIYSQLGSWANIGGSVTIPDNLKFSIADNILTITDGTNTWKLTAESTTE